MSNLPPGQSGSGKRPSRTARWYNRLVLGHPGAVLILVAVVTALLGWQATQLEVDASADTLLLEDDQALEYTEQVTDRYGQHQWVVVTYRPHGELFDRQTLSHLAGLRDELAGVTGVDSVRTILDVPLFGVVGSLEEVEGGVPSLASPDTDLDQA
ncbi:MAG: hypothetical protein ACOC93_05075, partial [Planctomycetota bacterium]